MAHFIYELKELNLPKGAGIVIAEMTGLSRDIISRTNKGYNRSISTRRRISDALKVIDPFLSNGISSQTIICWVREGIDTANRENLLVLGITEDQIHAFETYKDIKI